MNIFFEGLKGHTGTFCTCTVGFQFFRLSFWEETRFHDFTESLIRILFRLLFFVTGRFSPVSTPHWMQEKSAKIYSTCHSLMDSFRNYFQEPQAASGTISRVTGGFLYAATNSLKRAI
jgi:hypothetical protein